MQEITGEVKNLLEEPGKIKGEFLRRQLEFIEKREARPDRFKDILRELNVNLEAEDMEWISWGNSEVILEIGNDVFDWDRSRLFEMGEFVFKRLKLKRGHLDIFTDPLALSEGLEDFWNFFSKRGDVKVIEKKGKTIRIKIDDFQVSPPTCQFLGGFFESAFRITVGVSTHVDESCQEKHCKYLISWK